MDRINFRVGLRPLLLLLFLTSVYINVIFLLRCNCDGKIHCKHEDDLDVERDQNQAEDSMESILEHVQEHHTVASFLQKDTQKGIIYQEIECLINNEYSIQGRREEDEVYLPFSFIEKYFEVYGTIATHNGRERFEWHHSNAKIYPLYEKEPYKSDGVFMTFDHYYVESRDRVKYISGVEG